MTTREINSKPYEIIEYLGKLKSYAFLIVSLSCRELKIKYSRAILGIGWLVIQPLTSVVIYSLFFNYLIKIDTGNIPYIQFVFSGLVLWYIFTGIFSKGSTALLETRELIDKISFPRIIILIAKVVPVIIEGFVLFVVLIVILIYHQKGVGIYLFTSIFYLLQVIIFSFSLAILFSILIVQVRDFLHILPFIINFGIWLTPVFYPISMVPVEYQNYIRYVNPIAYAIEGFRDTLFSGRGISMESLIFFLFSLIVLFLSFVFFIKFEKQIVEKL